MVAPTQNLLAKNMLTHIGIALTLGGTAAFGFWHKVVVPNRNIREEYYVKLRADKA
ncbi:MAG: hypothetical protein J3Q66DRAFT_354645 [Benniella sp.]|nr:MAG: hypothetical protein J3Q66DRAFT_354645 [Benniella sp.]